MRSARSPRKLRTSRVIVVCVLVALVVARLCLPAVLKWYVNKTLSKIPGYYGHVEDIDVHLWRGAYEIVKLDLKKLDGHIPVPFFSVESADLSIQWKELLHGSLVGKIIMTDPQLNFVDSNDKKKSQTSIDSSWQDRVAELFPVDINYFEIRNGSIHFKNLDAAPPVDIYLSKIKLVARNLSNSRKSYSTLLATVDASGQPMDRGLFKCRLAFNPFNKQPTFDMDSTLSDLPLASLNSFLDYYGGLKAERGSVNFYTECAAKHGAFQGYLKPFLTEAHFASFGDKGLSFVEKLKGTLGNFLAWLFKNPKKDSVATKIEFGGRFDDVNVKTWHAIVEVFHHAFVKALPEKLDNSVMLRKLKTASK
jgi:hypothetical protein